MLKEILVLISFNAQPILGISLWHPSILLPEKLTSLEGNKDCNFLEYKNLALSPILTLLSSEVHFPNKMCRSRYLEVLKLFVQNSFGHGNVAGLSGFGSGSVSCSGIKEPFQIKKSQSMPWSHSSLRVGRIFCTVISLSMKSILYWNPTFMAMHSWHYWYFQHIRWNIFGIHLKKSKYPLLTLECLLKEMSM